MVSIRKPPTQASENGPTIRAFTISRTGSLASKLVVRLGVGGRATNGIDYGLIGSSVTIPAGADSVRVKVRPVDDVAIEGVETVTVTLAKDLRYVVSDAFCSTIRITDNDYPPPAIPTVSIAAGSNASETGPANGTFIVSRSGDTSSDLLVNYTVAGSATSGSDYQGLAGSARIPAGSASAQIVVTPIDDVVDENAESVVVTLAANPSYQLGAASNASITIADNDPTPVVNATWSALPTLPVGRSEAMGATVNGKLYVFGGFADYTAVGTNRADCYDPATKTWKQIADIPVGLSHSGTAADDRYVYLAGGYSWNSSHTAQLYGTRTVYRYDTINNTWDTIQPLPVERATGQLQFIGRTLHYFGGADITRADRSEHWSLDVDTPGATWVSRAPMLTARNHFGSAVLNGKIYAMGGAILQDENETALTTMEIYDPATNTWSTGPSLPNPRALIQSAVEVYHGKIYVAGGEYYWKGFTAEVTVFDPVANTWSLVTPLPSKRMAGILVTLNDQLVFTTGYYNGFNGTTWTASP